MILTEIGSHMFVRVVRNRCSWHRIFLNPKREKIWQSDINLKICLKFLQMQNKITSEKYKIYTIKRMKLRLSSSYTTKNLVNTKKLKNKRKVYLVLKKICWKGRHKKLISWNKWRKTISTKSIFSIMKILIWIR